MSRRFSAIPPECEACPLPDCYPTDPRCPVLKAKAAEKGLTLPDVPPDAPVRHGARKYEGIAPTEFTDRDDYQRQYRANYNRRFRRRLVKVFLTGEAIEILRSVCAEEDRILEEEVARLLELMAEKARSRGTK